MAQNTRMTSEEESREMMAMWPDVVRDITAMFESRFSKWIEKVLQYNVGEGKRTRGLTLIYAYKSLAPKDQLTEDNIRLARILAWCMELVHGYFIVIDDINDRSLVRRGKPCWYRYENNNATTATFNDAEIIKCGLYFLIQKHFEGKEWYFDLFKTFHNTIRKIRVGQFLDAFSNNFGEKPNLDLFTLDKYNSIVECRTYYSLILPITAAMQLAGIKDPEMIRQANTMLLEIGHLFQVHKDYLACFEDPKVLGKDSTDIEKGKCRWVIVTALQRATKEQRSILEECYGFSDPEKVRRMKQLFTDLDLPKTYSLYEEETYNLINEHIQQICGLPHNMFFYLLQTFCLLRLK